MVISFITFDRLNNGPQDIPSQKTECFLISIGMAKDFSSQEILKDSGGP